MWISAEVEDDDMMVEAFFCLYKHVSFETFEKVSRDLLEDKSSYVKDWLTLAFDKTSNERLVPILEWAIEKETNKTLKKDFMLVLNDLKK